MHNIRTWIIISVLLQTLAGCAGMDTIQLTLDQPKDLDQLLEQHEFVRARQLTARHLFLDTSKQREKIIALEAAYEDRVLSESSELEAKDDLLGAVESLTIALERIPDSDKLRDSRTRLEQKRLQQIQINAREQLITRARYIANHLRLYQQQTHLQIPSAEQRREYARKEQDAMLLADRLLAEAVAATQDNNLQNAQEYLQLAQALNNSPAVQQALEELRDVRSSQHRVREKQANIKQAKQQKKIAQNEQKETAILLAETQQALAGKNLQAARTSFMKIPPSSGSHPAVIEVQQELDKALTSHVIELINAGDIHYRADRVMNAIDSWSTALVLDPENPELKERLDRANRVLARLEELKRRQQR